MNKKNFSSFIKGFADAWDGLAESLKTQFNIRFHTVATVVAIVLSFVYELSATEWCIILLAIAMVWMGELLNTAIEYVVDFISPEYNPIAGKIKDISAAAVLIAALASSIIGLIIFIPKILA
ncbi:MAG: hypothetical protein RIQ89_1014 [Bacteroidota bacterium]|jgi:undecaprenol kinase